MRAVSVWRAARWGRSYAECMHLFRFAGKIVPRTKAIMEFDFCSIRKQSFALHR